MAHANGGESIGNFFNFTNKPLPTIVTPVAISNTDWDDEASKNVSEKKAEKEAAKPNGLDYVKEFLEEEQIKIMNIKLGNNKADLDSRNEIRAGLGRSRGRRREGDSSCRGVRRGRGTFGRSGNSEPSIYGTIPDTPVMDTDVYHKYDFNQRVFDTSELVINRVRQRILSKLKTHQVMTIEGFTGCGKTTQVPQFILDEAVSNKVNCRIAVTQPRRIAAISVANRVASERNWRLGGIVGYQVGMDKRISEDTRLTYMTTGVLLQLLISRKSLNEWTHIIIDEVHERDLETDLLLLVIKKIMVDTANDRTSVILMSATLNTAKFTHYFPLWESKNFCGTSVNIKVDLPNQYPVKEVFLEEAAQFAGYENYALDNFEEPRIFLECYEIATKIIHNLDFEEIVPNANDPQPVTEPVTRGAVLVFLPGLLEIETMYKILTEINALKKAPTDRSTKWSVLPLHSSITNEEQQRVFIPARNGFRKIILATNIAESSITVPDIKYVIDFCLTKNLSCDPTTNYTCLRLEWASKNQCIQRRGRCGRVSPGTVYRMVSKKFYETLEQEARPEMLRSSLESVVLQVKLLDMGSPKSVLALAVDPPDESNIRRAVSNLKEIGALTIHAREGYDAYDGNLTFVGRVLSRLPIDIRFGRLILLGHAFDCLEEAVIIAAGLSVKSPFAYPYSKRLDAYLSKMSWSSKSFSDCVALFHLYKNWFQRHQRREFTGFNDEKQWAKTYFVQLTSLREMKVLIDELYKRLRMCGIEVTSTAKALGQEQLLLLKLVIAGAFYPNYFSRPRPNARDYQKDIARDVAGKDPYASVVLQGFPMEQPGELYKKTICRYIGYQNCIPHVEFHGSRAVVTFDSRGSFIGPISTGVYRAVKLRQLRQVITFGTPSRDVAYKMLNDRKAQLESMNIISCPRQVTMPCLRTHTIQVVVTHIESPTEFFIVMKTDEKLGAKISEKLEECKRSLTIIKRDNCQLGQLCVVNVRGNFYRGRMDSERNNYDEIMVFLIDHGLSIWVRRSNVFGPGIEVLEAGLHLSPALAIQCRLKEMRPALRTDCVWCSEALALFDNYCHKNKLQCFLDIHAIVSCIISGEIRNSDDPNCISVNTILLEQKYADKCPEPASFIDNHTIRERMKYDLRPDVVANLRTFEEQQNSCKAPERMLDPPNLGDDAEQHVTLRGPHSPLEMTFTALCGSAHLKQVVTDGSSINSIALDQDPNNPAARLMIAANVAIAQRSGNILARETTLMPPIPGLTGLLAMLFCPKIEFRVDDDCSMYTGCLTGLGLDPMTKDSVYPDHDMEVVFDTQIDNVDVNLVNSIRSSMNALLTDRTTISEIRNLRHRMRIEAISLLERERLSMDEIWPDQTHVWTVPTQNVELEQLDGKAVKESGVVFPLHEPIALVSKPEGSENQRCNRNLYFMFSGETAQG